MMALQSPTTGRRGCSFLLTALLLSVFVALLLTTEPVTAFSTTTPSISTKVATAPARRSNLFSSSTTLSHDQSAVNDNKNKKKNPIRNIFARLQTHRHHAGAGSSALAAAAVVDTSVLSVMWNVATTTLRSITTVITTLTPPQKALLLATFALGFAAGRVRPFWKRYTDVNDIPVSLFDGATALSGRAVKVTDGDTIRFLHQPTPWHPKALAKKQKLSEYALPIRICSMDTPETAKFGKKGQPYGEEAKEALQEFLGDNMVYIKLLQKDQYSRAVAQVYIQSGILGKLFGRKQYVDEHLLKLGLAEVYRGGGAVYGPLGLEGYDKLEEEARQAKLGIWSMTGRESAAEYKKRTKE